MKDEMKRIKLSYRSPKYLRTFLMVLVLGCSQAQKPICNVNMLNTTGIQEGEKIVVLSETKSFWGYHEGKIGKCISKALKKQNRKIEIFPSDEFRQIFFSDLNLPEDYSTQEAFGRIFTNNEILKHIESFNIHHIVLADLATCKGGPSPDINWGIYAQAIASESTLLSGKVFDIKHKFESGQIITRVHAGWTNRGINFGGLPIPIYLGRGGTASEACKAFGEEVIKFLIGQETNQ